MIRYLIATLLLITTLPIHAISKYNVGDTLTVFAEYGLKLRNAPHKDSATIIVLPFGKKVVIGASNFKTVSHSDNFLGIHTIKGFWVQVTFDSITGYVFDGYLSSLPAPVLYESDELGSYSSEELYLRAHFKLVGDVFNADKLPDGYGFYSSKNNPNSIYQNYSLRFPNGITYTYSLHLEVGSTAQITFEKHSIEEVLLLARIIISDTTTGDWGIENKYVYNKADNTYLLGTIDEAGCVISISFKNNTIIWTRDCGC